MGRKYREYKGLNLPDLADQMLKEWDEEDTFRKSVEQRDENRPFIFYEGPPSANGTPGIHHVMARTVKDIFCRYKTQKGYRVERKAGWDTHGLPVELSVEKMLGITKEDIGTKISIEQYNKRCREEVMKYTGEWERMTRMMGYWVDMQDPYVTYDNKYIETLWWVIKQLFDKGLVTKGYTIQPYSPAAGTGLSNHELNQPGSYRDVTDTTCTAQFKVVRDAKSEALFQEVEGELYILAWTTTPWTLPSNTALAVGAGLEYVMVRCKNPYKDREQVVIVANDLISSYFGEGQQKIESYEIIGAPFKGEKLEGVRYEQLIGWMKPLGDAFRVIIGDFVTTEDGTGIVHIAPTFGADDDRVAKLNDISPLHLIDKSGKTQPMVDRTGKYFFLDELDTEYVANHVDEKLYSKFEGRFVKNEYDPTKKTGDETLDIEISVMLKAENRAFRIERLVHSYPHCWRTNKPVLYYPLDSWFIRTTAVKDRLVELNKTIYWKPESTGSGRFGKWLEGVVDWNLSRSRFWGTPLPIWATEDHSQIKCVGSIEELKQEIDNSVEAGLMTNNPLENFSEGDFSKDNYNVFDLHRPYIDEIILVSESGERMEREADLMDVWFDSGAMPYAQVHYPFEMSDKDFGAVFPADFVAEGVDQTRGWFYTLHSLSTMLFDSVAFKNIISNGLVLDSKGNKMSKSLGNAVDPFEVMEEFGADAVRWYMISNSQPWDNLKFDIKGVDETRRKYFGTLYNTYSFFALYANVDGFTGKEKLVPIAERAEIDRWIISLLNTLVAQVTERLEDYDPTPAARMIQEFVDENLSNWYVRLNRRRFWAGEMTKDKLAAYQTLYESIETVAKLSAPFAPFFSDRIFKDLDSMSGRDGSESVHLTKFPEAEASLIDNDLEEMMSIAQKLSSMVLALRRKVNIKVRQPLSKIMVPILDVQIKRRIEAMAELIMGEVNIKEIELIEQTAGLITKRIKPNFKTLGPKYGKQMKQIATLVNGFTQDDITKIESNKGYKTVIGGEQIDMELEDFEITSEDMPGWLVASEEGLTVALDISVTEELRREGMARELINRIQNLRKDSGLEVTDKITVQIEKIEMLEGAISDFGSYIAGQTLAESVTLEKEPKGDFTQEAEIDENMLNIAITKRG